MTCLAKLAYIALVRHGVARLSKEAKRKNEEEPLLYRRTADEGFCHLLPCCYTLHLFWRWQTGGCSCASGISVAHLCSTLSSISWYAGGEEGKALAGQAGWLRAERLEWARKAMKILSSSLLCLFNAK
jgi:hypothetical protein